MAQDLAIEWTDDLLWCPSQCYGHVSHGDVDYVLYLRWRWEDPWQGHIVENARDSESMHREEAVRSADLLEARGLFFTDEQLDQAKAALIEIFRAEYAS